MKRLCLIIHDVRSAHNVGSMLRTAEGLGLERVYMSGYTPHPAHENDSRLPHVARAADRQIAKTALGAEKSVSWSAVKDIGETIAQLKADGWLVCALEQTTGSSNLTSFKTSADSVALLVGNEVDGLPTDILGRCQKHLEIPMAGAKESFNVSVAAAIALYHLKYHS